MTAAVAIRLDGSATPQLGYAAGDTITLSNANNTDVVTWLWELVSKPASSTAVLSSSTAASPTFTADRQGSYLVRLTVNAGLSDTTFGTGLAAVLHERTGLRVPAAQEAGEAGAAGWASAVNALLALLDARSADPGLILAANTTGGTLTHGAPVRLSGFATMLSGQSEEFVLPGVTAVDATTDACLTMVFVVEGTRAGAASVPNGAPVVLRLFGVVRIASAMTPGDRAYLSDAGGLTSTAGTVIRELGVALESSGGQVRFLFDGRWAPRAMELSSLFAFTGIRLSGTGATEQTIGKITGTGPMSVGTYINSALQFVANSTIMWKVAPADGALTAVGGNRLVSNVADPVSDHDAVNKAWALAHASSTVPWDVAAAPDRKTTTDATPVSMGTVTPTDARGFTAWVFVQATVSDLSLAGGWALMVSGRKISGAVTVDTVATMWATATALTALGADASATASGGDLQVLVTGVASTTIEWTASSFLIRSPS